MSANADELAAGRSGVDHREHRSALGRVIRHPLLRRSEAGLIGLLVLTTLGAAIALSDFRTAANANEMLNNTAQIAIVAIGEAVVILARQIDLSVGATLGLSAYLVGSAAGHISGPIGPVLGVVMALGLGGSLGIGNALLVDRVKMPAIIATLATLSIYSGLQVIVTNGSQLYVSQVPTWLANLRSDSWLGIGPFIWIAGLCLGITSFVMRMTRFGRDIYAMGSNPEAAAYLGIRARLRTYEAFAYCGALAGLGGLLYTSQYGNVDATAGNGLELTVIAAAVVGGVSLFGGSGTPLSAVLGALLLTEIENILALMRISIFAEQTLEGSAIVVAVAIYAVASRKLRRPVRRELLAEMPVPVPAGRPVPSPLTRAELVHTATSDHSPARLLPDDLAATTPTPTDPEIAGAAVGHIATGDRVASPRVRTPLSGDSASESADGNV